MAEHPQRKGAGWGCQAARKTCCTHQQRQGTMCQALLQPGRDGWCIDAAAFLRHTQEQQAQGPSLTFSWKSYHKTMDPSCPKQDRLPALEGCMPSYLHRCWQSLLNTMGTSSMPAHNPSPCSALFRDTLCSEKHDTSLNLPLCIFPAHVHRRQAHMCMQQVLLKLLPTPASHCVLPVKDLCKRNLPATSPANAASQTQTAANVLTHPRAGTLSPRCALPGVHKVMFPNT